MADPKTWLHGTRHEFAPGDLVGPPRTWHAWAALSEEDAHDYAHQAKGDGPPRVYEVEPTGPSKYADDDDQYKSASPMRVTRERPYQGGCRQCDREVGKRTAALLEHFEAANQEGGELPDLSAHFPQTRLPWHAHPSSTRHGDPGHQFLNELLDTPGAPSARAEGRDMPKGQPRYTADTTSLTGPPPGGSKEGDSPFIPAGSKEDPAGRLKSLWDHAHYPNSGYSEEQKTSLRAEVRSVWSKADGIADCRHSECPPWQCREKRTAAVVAHFEAADAAPEDKIPEKPGLWYRAHLTHQPLDEAHARSRPLRNEEKQHMHRQAAADLLAHFGEKIAAMPKSGMAWVNQDPKDKTRYTPVSVRHAGFAGLVSDQERDDEMREDQGEGHDSFDEDLYDETSPEPTEEEQAHYEEHGEHPESYYERHDNAYQDAVSKKHQEDVPDHDDPDLMRFIGNHGSNAELWKRHGTFGPVDIRQPVYATQSHVAKEHIDRYLKKPDDTAWHEQRYGPNAHSDYLADEHPMFVTHEGRLHTTDGHHRVAAALARDDSHVNGWHFNLDEHPHFADMNENEAEEHLHRQAAAEPKEILGHFEAADADYRMQHQGPDADDGEAMHEVGSGKVYPKDIHQHPDWYIGSDGPGNWDSYDKVRGSKDWPSRRVTMYRSLPSPHREVNTGDWVTSSAEYAREHGRQGDPDDDWPVVKFEARADQLRTAGDSINEWSYHGPKVNRALVHFSGGKNHRGKGPRGGKADAAVHEHEPPEMNAEYNRQNAERRQRLRAEREAREGGQQREAAVVAHFAAEAAADPGITVEHHERPSGGATYPHYHTLTATHPDGNTAELRYMMSKRSSKGVVDHAYIPGDHAEDLGKPLVQEARRLHPGAFIKGLPGIDEDWGRHLPGVTSVHRNLTMKLGPEDHALVHDESVPKAQRARHLMGLMEQGGASMHWASQRGRAAADKFGDHDFRSPGDTQVSVNAAPPAAEHVETDPERISRNGGYAYQAPDWEVPLKEGAPVTVSSVRWRAGDGGWTSHQFKGGHEFTTGHGTPGRTASVTVTAGYGPQPPYVPAPEGASDDENMEHFDRQRAIKRDWESHVLHGISTGQLHPDKAKGLGFYFDGHQTDERGHSKWQPMPQHLYHVTTDLPGVREHGLKSRRELAQQRGGHGLGGGPDDMISLTDSHETAQGILRAVHEFHHVVNGRYTPAQMWEDAKAGTGAPRPFHEDLASYWRSGWKDGDELPRGLDSAIREKQVKAGGLVHTPQEMAEREGPGWTPHHETSELKGGDGQTRYNVWERDHDPDSRREHAADFYKTFAAYREYAGGHMNPTFFSTDTKAFAAKDPKDFAIVHARPRPGAMGHPVSALGEWRTGTGDALETHRAERLEGGHLKEASVTKDPDDYSANDEWDEDAPPEHEEDEPAEEPVAHRNYRLPYMTRPPEGELIDHLHHHHGLDARTSDLYMNAKDRDRWHASEHQYKTNSTHQHDHPQGAPGEEHWPDVFELSEHTDFPGGTRGDWSRVPGHTAPFKPLRSTESVSLPEVTAVHPGDQHTVLPQDGEEMWRHLQEGHGLHGAKTPGTSFMNDLHSRFHSGQTADPRRVPHQHENPGDRPASGQSARDSISRMFTPIPPEELEAQRRAREPKPERLDNREYSINDVSRHYDWEGFGSHEIEHLVHHPERAVFTREDVPVKSLRHADEHGRLVPLPSYRDIAGQGNDERERLEELERGYDQGDPVPPIVAVRDGEHHVIADGSHRAAIHAEHGQSHIPAFVTQRTIFPEEHTAAVTAAYDWNTDEGPYTWDEIAQRHPRVYGDDEDHAPGMGEGGGGDIADAAAELYHDRPSHPYSDSTGELHPSSGYPEADIEFHPRTVDVSRIDYMRTDPGERDPRVERAKRGFQDHRQREKIPPLILVHRHGVYQVADGHHRANGAAQAGWPSVRAYVAYSPHEDEPFAGHDGEPPQRGPFHGAEARNRPPMTDHNGEPARRVSFLGFPHTTERPRPQAHEASARGRAQPRPVIMENVCDVVLAPAGPLDAVVQAAAALGSWEPQDPPDAVMAVREFASVLTALREGLLRVARVLEEMPVHPDVAELIHDMARSLLTAISDAGRLTALLPPEASWQEPGSPNR